MVQEGVGGLLGQHFAESLQSVHVDIQSEGEWVVSRIGTYLCSGCIRNQKTIGHYEDTGLHQQDARHDGKNSFHG
jgi:hypothetical protein